MVLPQTKKKSRSMSKMTPEAQKIYNDWYWNVMVKDALSRILPLCKRENKNFELKGDEKDFMELVKYLEIWEKEHPQMDSSIKRDLDTIRGFEGYEKLVAA